MYQRILLAVDLTEYSDVVARKAWELASQFDATLYLLNVLQTEGLAKDRAANLLQELADTYFIADEHQFLEEGLVADTIVAKAHELNVDAIVLGSRSLKSTGEHKKANAHDIIQKAEWDVVVVHYEGE